MVRMGGSSQTKTSTKKKATPAKAAKPTKPVEKKNYTHLIIEFLAEGTSAVEKMMKEHKMKPSVARRAAKELHKTHPEKADLFIAWVEKNYPLSRGKTEPQPGETRTYSAQQVKNKKTGKPGPVFARTPLGPLGITRKDDVDITFLEEAIVILPAGSKGKGISVSDDGTIIIKTNSKGKAKSKGN